MFLTAVIDRALFPRPQNRGSLHGSKHVKELERIRSELADFKTVDKPPRTWGKKMHKQGSRDSDRSEPFTGDDYWWFCNSCLHLTFLLLSFLSDYSMRVLHKPVIIFAGCNNVCLVVIETPLADEELLSWLIHASNYAILCVNANECKPTTSADSNENHHGFAEMIELLPVFHTHVHAHAHTHVHTHKSIYTHIWCYLC